MADTLLVSLNWPSGDSECFPSLATANLKSWSRRDEGLSGLRIERLDRRMGASCPRTADEILALRPALVGFSCFVWNIDDMLEIARLVKARSPETRILLGGPQVSEGEEVLARWPFVDLVALGEGEESYRQLLRCLFLRDRPLAEVQGLAYRAEAGVSRTAPPDPIDLALLPAPYLDGSLTAGPGCMAVVESSRGCPFTCSFCDWGSRKMRYISLERLETEFQAVSRRCGLIHLTDADLLMTKPRGVAILEAFLRATADSDCALLFETNPLYIVPEIVDVIARSPAKFSLACGLQSIDEAVLNKIHRTFDRKKIEANVADLRRRAPEADFKFSVVFGLPLDTLEGHRRTLEWALRQRPRLVTPSQLMVLPGTELQHSAAGLGLRTQSEAPHQVLSTPAITESEMMEARALSFYIELSLLQPELREALLAAGDRLADAESPHVEVIEAWAARLRAKGIDLTMGLEISRSDRRTVSQCVHQAFAAIRRAPALLPAIIVTTEVFAREIIERGSLVPA